MTVPSPEQTPQAPEKHLDTASPGATTTMPGVDRVALLKDFKPSDVSPTGSLPGLTITGLDTAGAPAPGDSAAISTAALAPKGDTAAPASTAIAPNREAIPGKGDAGQPPVDPKQQAIDSARQALESPDASIKQKMEAMSSLYDNMTKGRDGSVHVTLNDGGQPRDFAISRDTVGKGVNLLQLSSQDGRGNSHPVLRAVDRHGQIEQQRYNSGHKASYQGDWWSAHSKESTVSKFGQTKPQEGAEPPVRPPERPPAQEPAHHEKPVAPGKHTNHPGRHRSHKPVHEKPAPSGSDTPPPPPARQVDGHPPGKQKKPVDTTPPETAPDQPPKTPPVNSDGRVVVSNSDRSQFYTRQTDNHGCAAMAVAMLDAHQRLGRPVKFGAEAESYERLTGTTQHGYRGSLDTLASQIRSLPNMEAKAYSYGMGNVGPQAMADLNKELDQGHSAVAKVINPHTGNPHYIMIEGRDANGKYILGDPDRYNTSHFQPVSQAELMRMMHPRDGFVAGWKRPGS